MRPISLPVKVTLIGTGISFILAGFIVVYYRRRRRRPGKKLTADTIASLDEPTTVSERKPTHNRIASLTNSTNSVRGSPKSASSVRHASLDDITDGRRSMTPVNIYSSLDKLGTFDDSASTASTIIDTHNPEHLCQLGVRSIKFAIEHWEDALDRIDKLDENSLDKSTEGLQYEISEMLERAYRIQDVIESKTFRDYNTDVALHAAIEEMDKEYDEERRRLRDHSMSASDLDSFVSAKSYIDLSNLDDLRQQHAGLELYEAALVELEHEAIPYRALRTNMLKCSSDSEYLAKLHCVRAAFQRIFQDKSSAKFFATSGQQIVSKLFLKADKDAEDFEREYQRLIEFVQQPDNMQVMQEELHPKGVKIVSFYDVVIDLILLDAFDDLTNPPSSVVSVANNRWLSNGFKESALSTAVWSVIKAKKQMLKVGFYWLVIPKEYRKVPRGFYYHFYTVSEYTAPLLAWGFLGPDTGGCLKPLCFMFKDSVLEFVQNVFNFNKVRYTTVDQMADDVKVLARRMLTSIIDQLEQT